MGHLWSIRSQFNSLSPIRTVCLSQAWLSPLQTSFLKAHTVLNYSNTRTEWLNWRPDFETALPNPHPVVFVFWNWERRANEVQSKIIFEEIESVQALIYEHWAQEYKDTVAKKDLVNQTCKILLGDADVLNSNHTNIIAFQGVILYFTVLTIPIAHRRLILKALDWQGFSVSYNSCGRR